MIVQCATCQSRSKIGDEKVTEQGVKVRCTKCGAVFVVRREGAPPPRVPPQPAQGVTPFEDLLGDWRAAPPPLARPSPPSVVGAAPPQPRVTPARAPSGEAEFSSALARPATSLPALGKQTRSFEDPLAGLDFEPPFSPLPIGGTLGPSRPQGETGLMAVPAPSRSKESDLELDLDARPAAPGVEPPSFEPPASAAVAEPPLELALPRPPPTAFAARVVSAMESPQEDRSLLSALFSGLAFVSLVIVILLAFTAYRNGGQIDLRDPIRTIPRAFGLGVGPPKPVALPVRIQGSGLYPTLVGRDALFVKGVVENHGPIAQALILDLVVRDPDGHDLAHGEGWPGRLPTPKDLYGLAGPEDLARLDRRLSEDPPRVPSGGSLPFIIAALPTADPPAGSTLIVTAKPLPSRAPPRSTRDR